MKPRRYSNKIPQLSTLHLNEDDFTAEILPDWFISCHFPHLAQIHESNWRVTYHIFALRISRLFIFRLYAFLSFSYMNTS
jgi:hypothetical protein